MGKYRENPLSLDVTGQIPVQKQTPSGIAATDALVDDLPTQIRDLHNRILRADQAREGWLRKQKNLYEQRRGLRKPTRVPWVGANNDNWPLTDSVIRRWKPGIVSLVLSADPVAWFFAMGPEDVTFARTAQDFYHWLFTTQIYEMHKTVFTLADYVAQYGVAYTRQGWEYRTDKMCRIARVSSLFPGGPEQAYQQLLELLSQQGAPIEQMPDLPGFVRLTLAAEYAMDENDPADQQMLNEATDKILSGANYVKIYYDCVLADRPSWKALDPRNVVVPSREDDPAKGDYVCILHRLTADELLRMAKDGLLQDSKARELAARIRQQASARSNDFSPSLSSSRFEHENDMDVAEGVDRAVADDESETVWEIYCKLDINGDALDERVIMWYYPGANATGGSLPTPSPDREIDTGGMILSIIEYPMPFEEWPVVMFEFEHTTDRPLASRGAAELLSTYQKSVNRMHNSRLDAIQIMLSPMLQMRATAGQILRNLRFRPGLIVPVQTVGDIGPIPMDHSKLQGFLQEENLTANQAEQYIGVFDPGILAQNASERRTATEVEAVTSQVEAVFTQDATLFQRSMAKVHRQLWQLWLEFGPDEIFFRVTGEEQPKLAKKYEIDRQFDISPAGTPANTNKAVALARARESLQLLMADESGLIDKAALFKHYLDLTDRNLSKLVVRSPEDAAAVQTVLRAASAATGQPAQSF